MKGGSGDFTWSIATTGKATFNHITANKGGSIGGWTIGSTYLKGGTLTLNNSGAVSGSNWSVSKDGLAHFSKIYGQVANNYTFVGGGTTITGGGGTSLGHGSTSITGGPHGTQSLSNYVKSLTVDALNVASTFTFQGRSVKWDNCRVIVKRSMTWNNVTLSPAKSISASWKNLTKDGYEYAVDLDISWSHYSSYTYATDLSSTSWYRDLWLLVGKGNRVEGGGEA